VLTSKEDHALNVDIWRHRDGLDRLWVFDRWSDRRTNACTFRTLGDPSTHVTYFCGVWDGSSVVY